MFQNEIEFEETITTLLDDYGHIEDVQIFIDDDNVIIRQWSETKQSHEHIILSHKMFYEFQQAMKMPAGLYTMED